MILLITWLQMRIPSAMLGRMMSLIMFTSIGLAPVATAVAGAILKVNLHGLFIGSGTLLLLVAHYGFQGDEKLAKKPKCIRLDSQIHTRKL